MTQVAQGGNFDKNVDHQEGTIHTHQTGILIGNRRFEDDPMHYPFEASIQHDDMHVEGMSARASPNCNMDLLGNVEVLDQLTLSPVVHAQPDGGWQTVFGKKNHLSSTCFPYFSCFFSKLFC